MGTTHKIFLVTAWLALVATAWSGWQSETVASEGDVGWGCSLAVDRWGRPQISYVDKTQGKVMYARYGGTSWEFETVASDVDVTGRTALALDALDNPYVVFQDNTENELTYARRSGTNWVTETIVSGVNYGNYVSINVWPDMPRVTYTQPVGNPISLRYAYRDGEGWHTETVVSSGGGNFNSLFIDNQGNPGVVYVNDTSRSVRYGVRKGSTWSLDDIAEGTDCDAYVGPDGKAHVGFAKLANDGIYYAVSTSGGSWNIENVPGVVGSPAFTEICVNGAGNVFLSYFNFDKFNLHVMIKKGSTWTHELVATGAYVGLPHSSGISAGYPVIAYYDSDNKDLKLARYFTDAELTSFKAERVRGGVAVRWAVDEAETFAGYNIYRETSAGGCEKVNGALIEGRSPFTYVDDAAPETKCSYWLEVVVGTGTTRTFGPASVPPATKAATFALRQNVPNPASGAVTFAFELPEGADVTLAVYDVSGRKVATVAHGFFPAGSHDVPFGVSLVPGVYVYRLEAGARSAARKMVVVK
jgi:hypothetical protein